MIYSRITGFLSMAVLFALVLGVTFAERSFAQTTVEILATDLADDPDGADAKKAYQKVNAKIATATAPGTVVTFPSGEFEDVGEIVIIGREGKAAVPASGSTAAVAANPITFRGNNTVFTGKIMFNVQDSQDIVIEGFTFRDTQVPDTIGYFSCDECDGSIGTPPHWTASLLAIGTIWLNQAFLEPVATSPTPTGANCSPSISNVTIRGNQFRNTFLHGIVARTLSGFGTAPSGNTHNAVWCEFSSAIEISDNVFTGIGLSPKAAYLDAAKTIPGDHRWKSAVQSQRAIGWTVKDNYIGAEKDGELAAGTTWTGIKIDAALGKTVIENNVVNGTASSGIVVGGNGTSGSDLADADEAEITIRNNKVTNSRNDAYFVHKWRSIAATGSDIQGEDGYLGPQYGYLGTRAPGAGILKAASIATIATDKAVDALLKPRVWSRPAGWPTDSQPYLGEPGSSRLVSSIVKYSTNTASTGVRISGSSDPATDVSGLTNTLRNSGDIDPADASPGTYDDVPEAARIRNLKPGLEAGIELSRLTAESIVVENNELTDNVVGLVVCPTEYCYADDPFQSIVAVFGTPAAGTLKVPTLTANRIYNNRKRTDMPPGFVRADVVNALTTANVTGSNVLVLAGNYLGDRPEVEGAVNDDDLAMDDANTGPKETVPPALSTDGATFMGTSVTLMYGEALDGESVPAAAAFTVTQMDSDGLSGPITVSSVAVAGMSVTLTLAEAPGSGNSVTVSYDPAKAGGNPIQDEAGNAAAALSGQVVSMTPEPVDPGTEMPPTEMPPAAAGGDGGCALASGGSGIDLGMLLLTVVPFAFVLVRRAKEAV